MATQGKQCNTPEDLLVDDIGDPLRLKLSVLQSITNNFSEEHIIGSGGFGRVYKLLNVYWLAVIGEIATEDLTPRTRYAVYLVYKMMSTTNGLRGCKKSSLRLYGEITVSTNKVSVDPVAHGMASVAYPVTRGDGWMEL
uniref:Uncharacterized protein n=1 Tax=Oryza punctata TaxID=4537 RepID=A0A0E0MMH1_ORYPU